MIEKDLLLNWDSKIIYSFFYVMIWHFLADNYSRLEAKAFFEANYSHIYFIFNDNFSTVEADLKQRGLLITFYE